ncbi:hypothetical protein O9992_11115 [Vibrio lentus]|nr:hypothetical protein [Vibrio lentus]
MRNLGASSLSTLLICCLEEHRKRVLTSLEAALDKDRETNINGLATAWFG